MIKIKFIVALLVLSVIVMGLAVAAPTAAQNLDNTTFLPAIGRGHLVLPPSDEASTRISVPAGFAIRIFAIFPAASTPRLMQIGPDGELYVALMNTGQVVRLPDRNNDGLSDGIEVAAAGLNIPHSVEWRSGWMYVAEGNQVSRLRDTDADGDYEDKQIIVPNLPTGGHGSRTLHFGPDGKLYVSVGSSCDVCTEADPRRAAILRYNVDGTIPDDNPFFDDPDARKRAVWAYGLRNSVDFMWIGPNELWASSHGSDGLGDNLPPEEIMIRVEKGQSHGWPYCYTSVLGLNQPVENEVRDTRIALPEGFTCAEVVPAVLTVPAHSAPIGMERASSGSFPAGYSDDVFVALHGSWNTNTVANYRDCKVERVLISNGEVTGSETFANGWRAAGLKCGDPATWGRPADVEFGPDGAMYISDDKGNRIYRVIYTGQ